MYFKPLYQVRFRCPEDWGVEQIEVELGRDVSELV